MYYSKTKPNLPYSVHNIKLIRYVLKCIIVNKHFGKNRISVLILSPLPVCWRQVDIIGIDKIVMYNIIWLKY